MNRRKFLKSVLFFLGSTAVVSFVYPLVRFLEPPGSSAQGEKTTIKRSEIPVGTVKDIVVHDTPAILINVPDKGFIALSKVCTHLGCLVEYDKLRKILLCPCHAGVYSLSGNVLSGPPPKPLQKYPVQVGGETIVIG